MNLIFTTYTRLKRKLWYTHNIYSKELIDMGSGASASIKGKFKIIKLNQNHFGLLEDYSNNYRSKRHFQNNIRPRILNTKRFAGFSVLDVDKKEIAYLAWIDFDQILLKDAKFSRKLNSQEAYFFDDHCVPKYRRQGLHNIIFEKRISFCKENNIKTVLIAIMNDNISALSHLKKFDFKLLKSITVYPYINLCHKKTLKDCNK